MERGDRNDGRRGIRASLPSLAKAVAMVALVGGEISKQATNKNQPTKQNAEQTERGGCDKSLGTQWN